MTTDNVEIDERLHLLEKELSELRKRVDALEGNTVKNAVSGMEKTPKKKAFPRVVAALLVLCLIAGGAYVVFTHRQPAYVEPQIGDIITFGNYEQNNSAADGPEPIEWIVLDKQDGRALLLSRYILFQSKSSGTDWSGNSLRSQLNWDFFSLAFTPSEQERICAISIEEDSKTSTDKIFLLSEEETKQFFPTFDSRKCVSTPSAGERVAPWWLRSFYRTESYGVQVVRVSYVSVEGTFGTNSIRAGSSSYSGSYGVRPAMWVDITE